VRVSDDLALDFTQAREFVVAIRALVGDRLPIRRVARVRGCRCSRMPQMHRGALPALCPAHAGTLELDRHRIVLAAPAKFDRLVERIADAR
jgi:hypothetical protein